jgi:putative ABC transport system permease protein
MYEQERRSDNTLGFVFGIPVVVVLLFSMAGIHTLVAFAVAQRRREIGIRSALGAPPLRLVADVFRRDLSPVLGGAVVGILLAFPLDIITRQEGGVTLTMLSVSLAFLVMVTAGLLAVVGPARRLLRVDSTEALRG